MNPASVSVFHSKGEYARDEDDDGFHEVHLNSMEGVWSLLRSSLNKGLRSYTVSRESMSDRVGVRLEKTAVGLDQYEVWLWIGWYRHMAL